MGMPDGERIARLEKGAETTDARLERIEEKVDRLLAAFNLGEGRAIAIAKIGGLLAMGLGAMAWLYQNIVSPLLGKH